MSKQGFEDMLISKSPLEMGLGSPRINNVLLAASISIFEFEVTRALEYANDFISKNGSKDDSVHELLLNSISLYNTHGKQLLNNLVSGLNCKEIGAKDFVNLSRKLNLNIRLAERTHTSMNFNLSSVERIALWARDSVSNLIKDLNISSLPDISDGVV